MEDPCISSHLSVVFLIVNSVLKPFSFSAVIGLIIMIVLLAFSAMISGSEIAFFSLNPSQLNKIKTKFTKNNKLIIHLLKAPKRLLATILISNNFVNVAIVILSTYITYKLFDFDGFVILGFIIQVVIVTSLILLLGEIMPKIYAVQNAVKFATFMAKPLQILSKIFYPLSSLLINSTSIIDKRISRKEHDISMSELSKAIEITSDRNTPEEEKKILKGIVKFGDIEVKEIMKSRIDITAVQYRLNFHKLLDIILKSGYSRIPAYKNNIDNIIGILYIKDLLPYLNKDKNFNWESLLRPAFFVPENKKINDLLKEFQVKKIHLAIVVDEYGGTSGIVTLEDILEEIVGEISDEFDSKGDEIIYSKIDDNNYLFEGKTLINDFCKILEIEDDIFNNVKGESDTLAGLILEMTGKIPEKEESITFMNFIFKIQEVDKRRIKSIRVTIKN